MNRSKRAALEAAGFQIGDAEDFLGAIAPAPHPVRQPVEYARQLYLRGQMTSGEVVRHIATMLGCSYAEAERRSEIRASA